MIFRIFYTKLILLMILRLLSEFFDLKFFDLMGTPVRHTFRVFLRSLESSNKMGRVILSSMNDSFESS